MRILKNGYWWLLGAIVVLLAIKGCHWASGKHERDAPAEIAISLGMPVNVIERNAQTFVRFTWSSNLDGYAEYHNDVQHDLKVESGKLKFVLQGMKSIAMQAVDGKLQHMDDRPTTSLIFLDDAIFWSESVTKVLDQSGWHRDTDPRLNFYSGELGQSFSSIGELRKAFLENNFASNLNRMRIATWRNGREYVHLEIARVPYLSSPKRPLIEDQVYFPTITVALD